MAKYSITQKKVKTAAYIALINPASIDELERRIYDKIYIQKKYKAPGYSVRILADELKTNTRYISAVLNVRFGMNYTSLINKYRIEEAKIILADPKYGKTNIEDISAMVGFSNRQSFYASFFKMMGMTPREYRLQHLQQHPSMMAAKKSKPKKVNKTKAKPKAKAKTKTKVVKAKAKSKVEKEA